MKIQKIKTQEHNNQQQPKFKGNTDYLYKNLKKSLKPLDKFIKSQENLSHTRFIQDTVTNWMPKAIFARSLADFGDMSFLEFLESGIFYFAPPIVGEFLLRRNLFSKVAPKNIRSAVNEQIPKSLETLSKNKKLINDGTLKHIVPLKAALVLGCACIPIAEYVLPFAKNLFTLNVFKKSDFNNIANLNKDQTESKEQQEKVRTNSKKELKKAAIYSASALGAAALLAVLGPKSKTLQNISKVILEPGQAISKGLHKIGIKSEKADDFLKDYLKLDFNNNNGKLALSKGQLALTATAGLFGYSKAAKDRGKLDQQEVWTRVPLVVFYTIFGSAIFDHAFNRFSVKKNKFTNLIQKTPNGKINIPTRDELPALAEKISKIKKTPIQEEFNRLTKEKAIITAVPYAFSLLFMGFSLAAISRLWTQYRYNQSQKNAPVNQSANPAFTQSNLNISSFLGIINEKKGKPNIYAKFN